MRSEMVSDKKIANAVSGKTARACDCCIRKRARWYCPADDAFLCQSCDGTVHSANLLARRHERVRLKTASLKRVQRLDLPSWHRGLTRKPRTPRHGKHQSKFEERNPLHVIVPELGMEETTSSQDGESEEQLLYRVPIYDPFVTDFRSSPTVDDIRPLELEGGSDVSKSTISNSKQSPDNYMPSDMDLEEFAADVETLLGKGLDDELYGIEELGLLDCSSSINNNNINENYIGKIVKEEDELCDEGEMIRGYEIEAESNNVVIKEPLELSFVYDEHDFGTTWEDEDDHKKNMMIEPSVINESFKFEENDETEKNKTSNILLRLDYEAISNAWASLGSPWITGQRPEINLDDCWPHCTGTCGLDGSRHQIYGEYQMGGFVGNGGVGDGGREARVSRYREKRRTRLFSKKIRYEVRKLNAEKRPRMKGRFVKRSSFAAANAAFPK
ncbi:zinc finger protein CONSTANS-LIKE 16-like isoform X2 [Chenopodium quinoa]|uniref:zinc finger protein CONSTANS-LIKE 16-like isoform X2 n=1 Tax=Chenopodium quinoa TaxID=63459 RepID=UPI000B7884FC|nr:zinc finger protein CONSTANS-LIKE 16-like isoform X2 [Chenopodium quinoa]